MKRILILLAAIFLMLPSLAFAVSPSTVTYDTHGATNVPSQSSYDSFIKDYTNFYYAVWSDGGLLIYGSNGALSFDGAMLTSSNNSIFALYPDGNKYSQSSYNIQNATSKGVHVAVLPDTTKPIINTSLAAGTYTESQQVTLSANETAVIYYTLDGSAPTESSFVYSNPILIDKTTILKYFGKDSAGNKSDIVSLTYTIEVPSDRDGDGVPDSSDLYPDDPTNTPPAPDESSEADKKTQSILIMLLGLILTGIVMGGKGLL